MKKTLITLLFAMLASLYFPTGAHAEDISAASAVVYEPLTGEVLFEKNADERMLVASTTKIMTALVVLESCGADELVEVKAEHTAVEGSSMYLKAGESYTVLDLLYGLMLASGNDAAAALADHASGSMAAFAEKMNAKCAELGLENTHFVNSHGLDAEEHYSSARDLALITAAAMENESFREIFSTVSHTVNGITYTNHNKLLTTCEGCVGGKTGYTEAAGRILVSCAEREGMRLICVTISDPRDWDDHRTLYDRAYDEYRYIPLLDGKKGKLEVISGTSEYVGLAPAKPGIVAEKNAGVGLRTYLPSFVFAPVEAGEKAGSIEIYIGGRLDQTIDVYYTDTVFVDESMLLTPWERFKRAWYHSCEYGVYYPRF